MVMLTQHKRGPFSRIYPSHCLFIFGSESSRNPLYPNIIHVNQKDVRLYSVFKPYIIKYRNRPLFIYDSAFSASFKSLTRSQEFSSLVVCPEIFASNLRAIAGSPLLPLRSLFLAVGYAAVTLSS